MLKFSPFQAPVKFFFRDPDTAQEFKAHSRNELIQLVRNYRNQNGLEELEYIGLAIDNFLCGQPENVGKCEQAKLYRGFYEYLRGGIAVVKNIFYGEKNITDLEEAERRAAICIGCKYNVRPYKTDFETFSDAVAEASTGGKRTSVHSQLANCEVCSCPLRAKVFYKGPFELDEEQIIKMKAVGCWQV